MSTDEKKKAESSKADEPDEVKSESKPEPESKDKPAAKDEPTAKDEPASREGEEDEEDEEGWPRSWIVVTAILGVIAIIIVARLVGQGVQGPEVPSQDPDDPGLKGEKTKVSPGRPDPGTPNPDKTAPAKPGAPKEPGAANKPVLLLKKIAFPHGLSCVDKSGKVHAVKEKIPAVCGLPNNAASAYRLEFVREQPTEWVVHLRSVGEKEDSPILTALVMPTPPAADQPNWVAGSLSEHKPIALLFENFSKSKATISLIRLILRER